MYVFFFTFSLNVSKRKHVVAFVVAMGILYLAILLSIRKKCARNRNLFVISMFKGSIPEKSIFRLTSF